LRPIIELVTFFILCKFGPFWITQAKWRYLRFKQPAKKKFFFMKKGKKNWRVFPASTG